MIQPPDQDIANLIDGVACQLPDAENKLFSLLRSHIRTSVAMFMSLDSKDADDVVGETITVVFSTINRDKGFEGDLIRFAITIARNRCRNIMNQRQRRPQVPIEPLVDWIADDQCSPLDNLMADEHHTGLQKAVDSLGRICRRLLRAFYLEDRPIESIRKLMGLSTVQGIYYRRTVCLRKLGDILTVQMAEAEM
jgi:RNA polymerase sigma factor (sigma-70 family)